ncbi:MAG: twin-arginine translocase TatA/TatE family subunit [Anaerotardibacter sp.]
MPHIGPVGLVEIGIILLVVLIIFGPKNLPKLGTAIGKAVKNLREGVGSTKKAAEKKVAEATAEAKEKPAPTSEAKPAVEETVVEEVEVVEKPKPKSEA